MGGFFYHFACSKRKPAIYPDIKQVTQIRLYQISGAHCHWRGRSSPGAGWVNRCEGVSTKAHLFSVCWTKQRRVRWMEGPWGAPNSSVAWLLNSLTMLCLKAGGKWSFDECDEWQCSLRHSPTLVGFIFTDFHLNGELKIFFFKSQAVYCFTPAVILI